MQRVGWVERSDTHHGLNDGDGFREALNPSYDPLPDGQITWAIYRPPCPAPFVKIFRFAADPNQQYIAHRPVPQGALAIVTNAGRDAVDADGAFDESA